MELESVTPLDLLPGAGTGQQPPSHRDVRQALRIMLILALVAFPVAWFLREAVIGLIYFLGYVYLFLIFPVTAFAILGAIVFAVGWYLPLRPSLMRRAAWQRASSVLAAAVVLHTIWFLFGWVTFHPLCSIKLGVGTTDTGNRALIGKLDPAYADRFQRSLSRAWRDAAVRRPDINTILVRPAVALLDNEWNWNISYLVAAGPLPPELAEDKRADCLAIEQHAMVGGRAKHWRAGWGYWPWNTLGDGAVARWLRGLYVDR